MKPDGMSLDGDGPRRMGRFEISRDIISNEPAATLKALSRCIVLRCEYMAANDAFEYTALGLDFDPIAKGQLIPEYDVLCWSHQPDVGEIVFKRMA